MWDILLSFLGIKPKKQLETKKKKGKRTKFLVESGGIIYNWHNEPDGNVIARALYSDGSLSRIQVIRTCGVQVQVLLLVSGVEQEMIEWEEEIPKNSFWG